jgi:hypothetical protein
LRASGVDPVVLSAPHRGAVGLKRHYLSGGWFPLITRIPVAVVHSALKTPYFSVYSNGVNTIYISTQYFATDKTRQMKNAYADLTRNNRSYVPSS